MKLTEPIILKKYKLSLMICLMIVKNLLKT